MIYIKADNVDLKLMADKPGVTAAGDKAGEWVAFPREVYDGVVKELRLPTSCATHTGLRQKLADALRFEDATVKISIAAASELLTKELAKDLSSIFSDAVDAYNQALAEQRKKIAAVTEWFQDIFYGRTPQDPDRGGTFRFLEKLGFGFADGGPKLPAKYIAP